MSDYITFNEGKSELANNGLPSTCTFALSTMSIGATSPFAGTETYGGSWGEITGTGYARLTEAEPTASGGVVSFAVKSWSTTTHTDWPAAVRSIVLMNAGGTKLICAWNLRGSRGDRR
jgi:hypothetical protein